MRLTTSSLLIGWFPIVIRLEAQGGGKRRKQYIGFAQIPDASGSPALVDD